MAAVLGESRQAAKVRARLPVAPIAVADVDGRATMGERRLDQRLEEKMTRTITVIVAAMGAATLASAFASPGFAQSTPAAAGKRSVATEFSAQSRPEPARARTRIRVTPVNPDAIGQVRDALSPMSPSGQRTVVDASIDEVQDRKENTDKILSATRVVKLTMGLLAGLLALASLLLVANTIRLSMYARRREVEVMKLVGATDWFIRWPFVLEGVIVGALGALTAIVLLGVVKVTLVDPLAADFELIAAPDTMNFGLLIAVLLFASVLVSALGSGLSLRRFLRV